MALGPRLTWEVRSTGNANNGGGFDPSVAGAGTDFSQQDSPAVTIDNATITTSITANVITFTAGYTPTSADVGNVVHMLTGTNVTAGPYLITTVGGSTWTVTGAVNLPTSGTTTNATGRMGGALSKLPDLPTFPDGNTIWVRGSFSTASQITLAGSITDGRFTTYLGYTTTRGDNGLATITATANLAPVVVAGNQLIFRNFKIDGANTADRGITFGIDCYVDNLFVTRCNLSGGQAQNEGTRVRRSLFTFNGAGAAAGAGLDVGTGCIASECEAHDNKQGFSSSNGTGDFRFCLSHGNTGSGFYQAGDDGMRLLNCVSDLNGVDGLQINDSGGGTTIEVTNCIFSNNTGRGIRSVATDYSAAASAQMAVFFQNNAFYNNTAGNYGQVPQGASDILLTASPYTNAAGGDYSLNGTAGGGAALLGAGIPGGYGALGANALGSTGHLDVGAVQTLGSGVTPSATATMRSLWREATNERFTAGDASSAVPDSTVDIYLDYGLQALNREAHYHVSDATIALVAGQQEYSLPSDFVLAFWLSTSNFRKLDRSDVERWMSRGVDWRHEQANEPTEWALYANKLILRPAPSAEAVASLTALTLRYCSTPPSITTNGAEQLGSQEYRLVVLYGALLWSILYPESLVAQQRIAELQKLWESSLPRVIQEYAARNISS